MRAKSSGINPNFTKYALMLSMVYRNYPTMQNFQFVVNYNDFKEMYLELEMRRTPKNVILSFDLECVQVGFSTGDLEFAFNERFGTSHSIKIFVAPKGCVFGMYNVYCNVIPG